MKPEINNSICMYAWNSIVVNPNGKTMPCCRYMGDMGEIDPIDPRLSEQWVDLRNRMLNGKSIEGCRKCYRDESNGKKSLRLKSLDVVPTNNELVPLDKLEIAFNNLCNLACAHCNRTYSSTWYSEDYKNGKIGKIGMLQNSFSIDNLDLSKLTELKIIGGEPLMQQDKFTELLEKIELSNLTIRLCTNGTHLLNDKFKSQLKNVKKLILTVSLDGIHSVNDWYRWPSKFNSIIDNIKSYDGFQHNNIDKRIHCVINVINVLYLPEIINFVQDKLPGWTLEWDWIIYPDWQHASVLPKEIKFKLIDEFIKFNKVFSSKTLSNPYPVTINILLQENNRWNELKRNVTILSSDRNLDFLEMVPKFKDIWLL